ncbi:MAG: tRNA lysidine(34) synthetase TilS, partial [Gammaproteobacteria bacterium]|nr:tRNA lysidine(34) synthetase TilS [Gammaproteobacteria bacterium]
EVLLSGAFLLLAQHQDDQAETFLLQLMRGAGPKGLSAMPVFSAWGSGYKCRPLLGYSRAELEAYAQVHGLSWVEDLSNQSTDYDRNYLRHKVLPILKERWSGVESVISRSAHLCAESDSLLEELAATDLEAARDGHKSLEIASLLSLSPARRKNLIRFWIKQLGMPVPGYQAVNRIDEELLFARDDAQPRVEWQQFEARRYRDRLYVLSRESTLPELNVPWEITHRLPIPGLGILQAELREGPGLSLKKLGGRPLSVCFRQGGESILPAGDSHTRPLQKLLQREAVPPWVRERIPLVFAENELVAVVGFWYAAAFYSEKSEVNLHINLISNFQIE